MISSTKESALSPFHFNTVSDYLSKREPMSPLYSNLSHASTDFQTACNAYYNAQLLPKAKASFYFVPFTPKATTLQTPYSSQHSSKDVFSTFHASTKEKGQSCKNVTQLPVNTTTTSTPISAFFQNSSNSISVSVSSDAQERSKPREQFVFNKNECNELSTLKIQKAEESIKKGNLIEKIKDFKKTQVLQNQIQKISSQGLDEIVSIVLSDIEELIIHKYANYFISTLICSCNRSQRLTLLNGYRKNLYGVCVNKYGIHPMQNYLLMQISSEEEQIIRVELKGKLTTIAMNEFGSFIAMKLMRFITNDEDTFYQEIKNNFILLSQTEKGLNVIKSFITELKDFKGQAQIISIIMENSLSYIEDPYSNYAFQNIIKQWPLVITQPLFPLIYNNIMRLSVQQCSSNVVEALLYNAPLEVRKNYIREIISISDISSMMINRFGNFVLQKVISIASPDEKQQVLRIIKDSLSFVKSAKIKGKWVKVCNKLVDAK